MLPSVDFYLLSTSLESDRYLLVCRLAEKAYCLSRRMFIFCEDQQVAEILDELLWTFKAESFIPHNLQGEGPEPPPPIQIGYTTEPRGHHDILLNLASTIPSFYVRFNRIMEVLTSNDSEKTKGRLRFKAYREAGLSIQTHHVMQKNQIPSN